MICVSDAFTQMYGGLLCCQNAVGGGGLFHQTPEDFLTYAISSTVGANKTYYPCIVLGTLRSDGTSIYISSPKTIVCKEYFIQVCSDQ